MRGRAIGALSIVAVLVSIIAPDISSAGTWTPPETIGQAHPFAEPQFATNARGDVLLAWPHENHVEVAFAPLGGPFEAPEIVPGPARPCSDAPPVNVDLDDKGRAVIAWEHFAFTTFEQGCRIIVRASVRDSSGNFTPSQRLSSNAWDAYDPQVSIAGGRAAVTYNENCCTAFVATARQMRGFGDRRRVSSWAFDPFVDVDRHGEAFVYGTTGRRGAGIWERRQSSLGKFSRPNKLSREYAGLSLDVRLGAAQSQSVVWNRGEPSVLKAAIRVGQSPLRVRTLARTDADIEFDFETAATRTRQFAVAFTTGGDGVAPRRARLTRRFPGEDKFDRPRAMPEAIATERPPSLAAGPRGRLLAGWLDAGGEEVRATVANRAGDFRDDASFPLSDPLCVGDTARYGCERPAALITPGGQGYLAWVDGGTVRVSRHLPAN